MISNCKLSKEEQYNIKRRYWAIQIYPESVDKDYKEILKSLGYKIVMSPLHDKDIDDEGKLKKPHRHIMIDFGGGIKLKSVESIIESIKAYQHCEIVGNKTSMYYYFIHKNDKDKYQYDIEEMEYINSTMYDWTESGFKDILNYIDDYDCKSLKKLTQQLRKDEQDHLLEYVSKNTYYVVQYIKDSLEEKEYQLNELYNSIMKVIKNYELTDVIKSEEIEKTKQILKKLGINEFEIVKE